MSWRNLGSSLPEWDSRISHFYSWQNSLDARDKSNPEMLGWYIVLRWVAVMGQLCSILSVEYLFGLSLMLQPLLILVALTVISNLILMGIYNRLSQIQKRGHLLSIRPRRLLGFAMALDLLLLTALLFYSGGLLNPCSIFYMVNLCLGGMLLSSRGAWCLEYLAIGCFCFLVFYHYPLSIVTNETSLPNIRKAGTMTIAQFGYLMSFMMCSQVIVYFTTLLARNLREREQELLQAEQSRARGEKLEGTGNPSSRRSS